nr:CoA transferase [Lachnospiraceae bacterium]
MGRQALDGVRILDISTVIAAPWGAGLLADFGAEVIKVEMPGRGDTFRNMGPLMDGVSTRWPSMGRNKKTVTLDFHYEEGKKLFLELVKKSDVIFENFRTGTLEKWGLGIDVLREANPDIIVTHVTGYGQTGPYAKLAGLGTPLQAFSGMTYMQGYPDRPPVSPPLALADFVAGLNAALGTMIALYHRDALKGRAQEVDISLYEGLFRMEEAMIAQYDLFGTVRERSPMPTGASCPIGTFETKDHRYVIIVCSTDPVFWHLCDAMEKRKEWLPKYEKSKARLTDPKPIMDAVTAWVGSLTYDELKTRCDVSGVPLSAIYNMKDIFEDPHYAARHNIVEVPCEEFGSVKMPSVFPVLTETPGQIRWPGAKIGAYNEEIYGGLLGMSREELDGLKEKKVI